MALLLPSGTTSVDLAVAGTYRQDISDLLMAPLYLDPSSLGTWQWGEGFSGNAAFQQWNEEALNPSQVTDATVGGLQIGVINMVLSASDASVLDIGNVLADGGVTGGLAASERIQILGKGAVSGGQVTLSVLRGAQGTTPQNHAAGAIWLIISQAIGMNSDLGADKTRPRVPKGNYVQREDINVNLAAEVIDSSLQGYTPGVPNEFTKQIKNRVLEKMIILNRSFLYGIGTPGDGTTGVTAGNYSTAWGVIPMLSNTNFNSSSAAYNFATKWNAGQLADAINDVNGILFGAGVRPDYIYTPVLGAQSIAQQFKDQIRLVQDETTRGFYVNKIRTLLANELQVIVDGYLSNINGSIDMIIMDSSRMRLRAYEGEAMTLITSPSFRDGDAARIVIKLSAELRNTGSDTGQAHYYVQNVSV